jgi:heme-degrading monooxygenase HmoA
MHVILWEFLVREGKEGEFRRIYGPEGDWTILFRRGAGYLSTELWSDPDNPRRFLTLDRWTSREAFDEFRRRWQVEYRALDQACEALTEREEPVGSLDLPGDVSS